ERRGVYISSHNAYIEMLNDFGLLGVIIFISTLTAGLLRALYLVLTHRNCTLAAFCVVGLTAMAVHNATQVFFYSTATMVMLILLLTCGELAAREQRLVLRGIRSSSTAQRACASRGGALQEPRFHQTSRSGSSSRRAGSGAISARHAC